MEIKYYIIFIDDCTRYYYTYLFISKDGALEIFKHYDNKELIRSEVENILFGELYL